MIRTLLVTIVVEGTLAIGYACWRKKPLLPLVGSLTLVNLLTQSLLWLGLTSFPAHYRLTLIIGEVLIVLVEALLLYAYRKNQLKPVDALWLSLGVNLASFLVGLFLPV